MELSIDTSTRYAAVGLSKSGETVAELAWRSEQNHSVELAPAINRLLDHARLGIGSLDAIFVAKGPGGFSALRVGVSTAKALAMALGLPLVGVHTLDVEADPYLQLGLPVCALIGAGRSRLYAGHYRGTVPRGQDARPEYEVVEIADLVSSLDAQTLFCGEGVADVADRLRHSLGARAVVTLTPPPTRRASVLARLGYRRLAEGTTDDVEALQPIYMRAAQISTAGRRWVTPAQ